MASRPITVSHPRFLKSGSIPIPNPELDSFAKRLDADRQPFLGHSGPVPCGPRGLGRPIPHGSSSSFDSTDGTGGGSDVRALFFR